MTQMVEIGMKKMEPIICDGLMVINALMFLNILDLNLRSEKTIIGKMEVFYLHPRKMK